MKNKIVTLALLREARIDENRTPFSPIQISNLLNKYSNLKIIVQPSKKRCFNDEDYLKAGAQITDDLNSTDIIFGVKEVNLSTLINDKTYLFFHIQVKFDNILDKSQKIKPLYIRRKF